MSVINPISIEQSHANGKAPSELLYSVDWRFFVDIPSKCRALIISEFYDGFLLPLQKVAGARVIVWDPQKSERSYKFPKASSDLDLADTVEGRLPNPPFRKQSFNLILLPDGLTEIKHLETFYSLLQPGGSLIIGFSNRLAIKKNPDSAAKREKGERLRKMTRLLRAYGFTELSLYGAFPDHKIPEIIFPIQDHILRYSLKRHFGHKLPLWVLHWLSIPFISAPITINLLPAYYIIATKEVSNDG